VVLLADIETHGARAFGVTDESQAAGIPMLDEFKQHPSLHRLVVEGYEVITF